MQVIKLEMNHYNFYSPVTGGLIMSEDGGGDDPSCLGSVLFSAFEEDQFTNTELQKQWSVFYQEHDGMPDEDNIDAFFERIELTNTIVFRLYYAGSGPRPHELFWIVVDMDCEKAKYHSK